MRLFPCILCLAVVALFSRNSSADPDRVDRYQASTPDVTMDFEARARLLFFQGWTDFDEKPGNGEHTYFGNDLSCGAAKSLSLLARFFQEDVGCEAGFTWTHSENHVTLHRDLRWNRVWCESGERISTRFDWTTARLGALWKPADGAFARVDLGLALRYDYFTVVIEDNNDHLGIVCPEINGRVTFHLGSRADGETRGIPGLDLDARASFFGVPGHRSAAIGGELSVCLRYQLLSFLRVGLGYSGSKTMFRREDSHEDNELFFATQGPFLEVTLDF